MVVQNVKHDLLKVVIEITHHKELSKQQQSELKCQIPKSIVYDYLNYIEDF